LQFNQNLGLGAIRWETSNTDAAFVQASVKGHDSALDAGIFIRYKGDFAGGDIFGVRGHVNLTSFKLEILEWRNSIQDQLAEVQGVAQLFTFNPIQFYVADAVQELWWGGDDSILAANTTLHDGPHTDRYFGIVGGAHFGLNKTISVDDVIACDSKNITVTDLPKEYKAKVVNGSSAVVAESKWVCGDGIIDCSRYTDVLTGSVFGATEEVPIGGWPTLIVTDAADVTLDTYTGAVYPGGVYSWGGGGSEAGRKELLEGQCFSMVDRRVNGHCLMDLQDDVTYTQWINPCLAAGEGDSFTKVGGQRYELWSRLDTVGTKQIGYVWTMGGPPWWDGGANTAIHMNPGVNGFTFVYFPTGGTSIEVDGNALFWPFDWARGFDGLGPNPALAAEQGKYCGWYFCALVIGPVDANGDCEFTQWVGEADGDNLISLGTQIAPAPNGGWTLAGADNVMTAVNGMNTDVGPTDSGYENTTQTSKFAKYDESRIYGRALSDAEVRGLYNFPGGQKRAENLMESPRQVNIP
jgi:hypothetical protein